MWPLKGLDNRGSDNLGTTVVTLLTCSCKLVHCGVPGCSDCFAVALEVHVLVEICKKYCLCCLIFQQRHLCALICQWFVCISLSAYISLCMHSCDWLFLCVVGS